MAIGTLRRSGFSIDPLRVALLAADMGNSLECLQLGIGKVLVVTTCAAELLSAFQRFDVCSRQRLLVTVVMARGTVQADVEMYRV